MVRLEQALVKIVLNSAKRAFVGCGCASCTLCFCFAGNSEGTHILSLEFRIMVYRFPVRDVLKKKLVNAFNTTSNVILSITIEFCGLEMCSKSTRIYPASIGKHS